MEVNVVALVAELPNDNPALHRGVTWVCLGVTGASIAIRDAVPVPTPPEVALPEPAPLQPDDARIDADDDEPERIPVARISGIVGLGDTPRDDSEVDLSTRDGDDGEDDAPILVEELPPLGETACLEGSVVPAAAPLAATTTIAPPACEDPFTILVSTLADIAIGAGSPHVAAVLPGLLLEGRLVCALAEGAARVLAEADVVREGVVTPAFLAQTRAWRAILLGTSDDFSACGNAMLDEWAAALLAGLLAAPSRATALRRELRAHGVAAFGLVEAA